VLFFGGTVPAADSIPEKIFAFWDEFVLLRDSGGLEEMILELLKLDLTPTLQGLRRIVAMS
jgi:hypothetical protein